MRVLALETAVQPGSIALFDGDRLMGSSELPGDRRTTRSLIPAIRDALAELAWEPADIRLVAVSQGPGSFTGLRVGIMVAKTFAYAIGGDVLGIDTLEVIARQAGEDPAACRSPEPPAAMWTVMDAQRRQLFCAKFVPAGDGWRVSLPTQVYSIDDWLQQLEAGQLVAGPPLTKLASRLPADVRVVDPSRFAPQATTVGRLAVAGYRAGRRDDLWGLRPQYHRLSAAEEKRAQRDAPARGET